MGFRMQLGPTPDGVNPYGSQEHVPAHLLRCINCPEDLVRTIQQVKFYRAIDSSQLTDRAGVSALELIELEQHGKGTLGTARRVLAALGVSPVTLPSPSALRKGIEEAPRA